MNDMLRSNKDALDSAKKHQQWLKQFAYFKHSELVLDILKGELTSQKFNYYKKFYNKENNPTQPLFNTILTQFRSIKDAHGIKEEIMFDERSGSESSLKFEKFLSEIIDGKSYHEYTVDDIIEKTITEPSSVIGFVKYDANKEGEIVHFPLSDIRDFEMNSQGFNQITLKLGENYLVVEGGLQVLKNSEDKELSSYEFTIDKTPFTQLSNEKRNGCEFEKKSVMSDSMGDMLMYSILKPFYDHHKMFASFPIVTHPNTTETKREKQNKDIGRQKNPLLMGETIMIDNSKVNSPELVKALTDSINIISGDSNLLDYQARDIEAQKQKIYDDVLGKGYGIASKDQAINTDQVASNFDTQERNLNNFALNVSTTVNYVVNCIGYEFSNQFLGYVFEFGSKHFLKSVELLYSELATLETTTSNTSLIEDKHIEIILTKHGGDFLNRYKWISVLQPFSNKSQEYITANRDSLDADLVFQNETFTSVLNYFEMVYDSVENYMSAKGMLPQSKYKKLREEFDKIRIEMYGEFKEIENGDNREESSNKEG